MSFRRGHFSRYPYTIEGDGGGTFLNTANQSCGMIAITIDSTSNTQVFNGGIAYISERSGCSTIASVDVYSQRMAVTVECAAIASSIASSSITANREAGFKAGIYPIFVLGIFHHLNERVPVSFIFDGEYPIIEGRMAVSYRHSTAGILSCPRFTLVV